MKDNKQLNMLAYAKPEIELVRIQQENVLLTGSDDDGPLVTVEPGTEEEPTTPAPGLGGVEIIVIPPVQRDPENPFE